MPKMIAGVCLLAVGGVLAGCADFRLDVGGRREAAYSSPPPPAHDPRSIGDLRRENAQLRDRLARLEKTHADWQAALDRQKAEIRDLKRQREDLEKDRDRWKRASERSDD